MVDADHEDGLWTVIEIMENRFEFNKLVLKRLIRDRMCILNGSV